MVSDNSLAYQIRSLNFSLVNDNFVMFTKLYFIIFNRLVKMVILRASFFNVMKNLKQIDRDREYLPASLQSLLIFFILYFVLFLELGFSF